MQHRLHRPLTLLAATAALALGGVAPAAFARHGADDPAGHDRGDDHGVHHRHARHHRGDDHRARHHARHGRHDARDDRGGRR